MIILAAFVALLGIPVQRYLRSHLDASVARRVLLIREAVAMMAILVEIGWEMWRSHEPANLAAMLLVPLAVLGGGHLVGEMLVRRWIEKQGFRPVEGPRGPMY